MLFALTVYLYITKSGKWEDKSKR